MAWKVSAPEDLIIWSIYVQVVEDRGDDEAHDDVEEDLGEEDRHITCELYQLSDVME